MTKMADGVVIDLYADDVQQDFAQEEFLENDNVDFYDGLFDDLVSETNDSTPTRKVEWSPSSNSQSTTLLVTIGSSNNSITSSNTTTGNRYQLYIGNLTWWTTDQDIKDIVTSIGVSDFIEVKFFYNQANGQSKGFCVVTLGSEHSSRLIMDRLPKKKLHGQLPVVTFPTKQAFLQFVSQSKTRPLPPPNNQNMSIMGMHGLMFPQQPMMQQQGLRPRIPMHGMQRNPQEMLPPMRIGHRMFMQPFGLPYQQKPPPPSYQNQWNGPNHLMGPPRPGMPPHKMAPLGFGFASHQQGLPMQGLFLSQMMQGDPGQAPAPHINPAFFQQPSGALQGPPEYGPLNAGATFRLCVAMHGNGMEMSEQELEEIMSRNRFISSSAIVRAVTDSAAGEYSNAKQPKVANDESCKILVSSWRKRSRSPRDRLHRRLKRERSRSSEYSYRDRSRERDHDRERDRDNYVDLYNAPDRDSDRDGDRKNDRENREGSREVSSIKASSRSRKNTPSDVTECVPVSSKSRYYDIRYWKRERDRREDRAESSHRSSRH